MGSEQGLTAHGVETDERWVGGLREKLGEGCKVKAVNIGPTKEWGYPVNLEKSENFSNYSNEIFNHQESFDLILIDGRFRVACVVSAIQHALKNAEKPGDTRIFIHDFWNRPIYHVVLEFLDTVSSSESAGVFKIKNDVDHHRLHAVWEIYADQPA